MRRGDKLLKIDGKDLEDLSPEMFAELLSVGSPMLTVHQSSTDPSVGVSHREPGAMCPVTKEDTVLSFCLDISRDPNDCDSDEHVMVQSDCEEEDNILMVVEMLGTSMSVVRGRSCAHGETCKDCGGTDCSLDDVVVMSKKISLVSRGISGFLHDKVQENIALESLLTHLFVNCSGNQTQMKSKLAKISIYYYQSDHVDGPFKGVPVVLNFSGTDKFLRCSRHPDSHEVKVCVMPYDKSKLQCILKEDDQSLPFLFYMKAERDGARIFESAHCEGWFIHAAERSLKIKSQTQPDDSFFFIIRGKTF
ncbi:hypothetical protein ACEWY4_016597 [Coilia grayii]|uniref:Interleukin-1 n=1 Tax=Coilia grayii TaxID=363190 RepID=A0ABD1JKU5_9TELE